MVYANYGFFLYPFLVYKERVYENYGFFDTLSLFIRKAYMKIKAFLIPFPCL